ncbi:phosphatase PAP2 family protein [Angustibacter sp. McL0619]|uniref:phosphatase PAP2 family protein n=1 Tax=Angustibacter sp. McL0619 TaxID=3415676 RepID=UPI003CEC71DF
MSSPDDGLYLWVTRLAARSPDALNDVVAAWSLIGLMVLALLLAVCGWRARRSTSKLALVLMAPVAISAAFAVDAVLKLLVREVRPCAANAHVVVLEVCPGTGDWSFPSNHTVVAVAAATAIWMIDRRLRLVATLAAAGVGLSRVWVGVHYPHDVLAAVVVGLLVTIPLMRRARHLEPLARRLREGIPIGSQRARRVRRGHASLSR